MCLAPDPRCARVTWIRNLSGRRRVSFASIPLPDHFLAKEWRQGITRGIAALQAAGVLGLCTQPNGLGNSGYSYCAPTGRDTIQSYKFYIKCDRSNNND